MPSSLSQVHVAYVFQSPLREVIHQLKYRKTRRIAQPLGQLLAANIAPRAPYFDAVQYIVVKEDSKVKAFADLKPLKVGVQTGTTGDEVVSKLQGKASTAIKRFESTPLALKELEAGGVDAVVADNGVVTHYVANNPGGRFRTVTDAAFVPEQYGIAVRKGNAELLAKIDQGLAAIRADGTYDRIFTQYFGAKK